MENLFSSVKPKLDKGADKSPRHHNSKDHLWNKVNPLVLTPNQKEKEKEDARNNKVSGHLQTSSHFSHLLGMSLASNFMQPGLPSRQFDGTIRSEQVLSLIQLLIQLTFGSGYLAGAQPRKTTAKMNSFFMILPVGKPGEKPGQSHEEDGEHKPDGKANPEWGEYPQPRPASNGSNPNQLEDYEDNTNQCKQADATRR
jgi:hypothetical protein